MQSYLAYKRFGKNVQAQYDRDKKRAEAMQRGNNIKSQQQGDTSSFIPSSIKSGSSDTEVPSDSAGPDSRDLEKGEERGEDEGKGEGGSPRGGSRGEENAENGDDIDIERNNTLSRMGHAMTGIEVRVLSKEMTKRRSHASNTLSRSRTNTNTNEKEPEKETVFVVNYESEKDEMNPHNWSYGTRIGATFLIAAIAFIVGFASSVDSAALTQAADEFGVSEVTESLATGLFLIGFGFGALFAGPISETVGRNPVYIVTMAIYMIWIMASALSPNIGSQLVFRFLAGFFGSTPLTCAGGSISDLWSPMERVYAFPVFANSAFMGPVGFFPLESKAI
jgi:hypothetical protein